MNHRNPNPAYFDALAKARGVQLPQARTWSILLTSANHGTVGPVGSTFSHAGEHHERVQVMEIVEAGAPPAPGVDLPGLVRLELTNEQIAAGAIVRCDHGGSIGRSAAIEVWDAMLGVAPIAAQAGQVAVPVISSYDLEKVKEAKARFVDSLIHSGVQYRTCGALSGTLNEIIAHSEAAAPSPAKESK